MPLPDENMDTDGSWEDLIGSADNAQLELPRPEPNASVQQGTLVVILPRQIVPEAATLV